MKYQNLQKPQCKRKLEISKLGFISNQHSFVHLGTPYHSNSTTAFTPTACALQEVRTLCVVSSMSRDVFTVDSLLSFVTCALRYAMKEV